MAALINALYTGNGITQQIKQAFSASEPRVVQLHDFLAPAVYKALIAAAKKTKSTQVCIADRFCHGVAPVPTVFRKYFSSKEFVAFVKAATGVTIKGQPMLLRFGHRCYTLRCDDHERDPLVVSLDLTAAWDEKWGGSLIVAGEESRVIPVAQNSLTLADGKKAYPFVQYVNHYAKKQERLFLLVR